MSLCYRRTDLVVEFAIATGGGLRVVKLLGNHYNIAMDIEKVMQ
jgi:hypothetical protein